MEGKFVTFNREDVRIGEPLPGTVYLFIDGRFIVFRTAEDAVDRLTFDRLELKKVKYLFIEEQDQPKFVEWVKASQQADAAPPLPPENQAFVETKADLKRKAFDIFQGSHPETAIREAMGTSKVMVAEVMKLPFVVKSLAQLTSYSRGTVDHSVNVSVLATYLAVQIGYSHQVILQHVAMGGLMHDIGKSKVAFGETDSLDEFQKKMEQHPATGVQMLEAAGDVPMEVKLIVAQHHECHDGSGYPKQLKGNNIYDLAKIVAIANVFDELVTSGYGPLQQRQRQAIFNLEQIYAKKFDPVKFDKIVKVLQKGV